VPSRITQERSQILRELSIRKRQAFSQRFTGNIMRVLFEQRESSGLYTGLSDNYIKVGVTTEREVVNQLLPVRLQDTVGELPTGILV
jgi:threonylcarbamoyladenosine tRNA methylthiotransferase MtaB